MLLPHDIEISAHSRKFYDGTYTFTSNGYTDEAGVYREFDCYDPIARAPTPLPPRFDDDDDEDFLSGGAVQDYKATTTSMGAALPEELFQGRADRDRLIGRVEGIRLVDEKLGTVTSMAECFRLCGLVGPEESRGTEVAGAVSSKQEMSTEQAPIGETSMFKTPQKAAHATAIVSSPPLSDYPDDLSQYSAEKKGTPVTPSKLVKLKVRGSSTASTSSKTTSKPIEPATSTPSKSTGPRIRTVTASARSTPTSKATPTSGVAEKITKATKKARATTSEVSPGPALISTFANMDNQRRSGRLNKISK